MIESVHCTFFMSLYCVDIIEPTTYTVIEFFKLTVTFKLATFDCRKEKEKIKKPLIFAFLIAQLTENLRDSYLNFNINPKNLSYNFFSLKILLLNYFPLQLNYHI